MVQDGQLQRQPALYAVEIEHTGITGEVGNPRAQVMHLRKTLDKHCNSESMHLDFSSIFSPFWSPANSHTLAISPLSCNSCQPGGWRNMLYLLPPRRVNFFFFRTAAHAANSEVSAIYPPHTWAHRWSQLASVSMNGRRNGMLSLPPDSMANFALLLLCYVDLGIIIVLCWLKLPM